MKPIAPLLSLFFIPVAFVALCAAEPETASIQPFAGTPLEPGYKLTWSDEFSGSSLDVTKWVYRTDHKMESSQLPANVTVANGILTLHLKKEAVGGKQYTGGGVISKNTFKYGYYEAKLKTPPGSGWHTAFWTQKHDGSGGTDPKDTVMAFDVIFNDSFDPGSYVLNTHQWKPNYRAHGTHTVKSPNLSADFHVFGCEFTPDTVKYFFDGALVQTVNAKEFEHGDMNIWLTSIARLSKKAPIDDSKLPATAQFDYVRFFSK